jgi:hypothetical protein
MTTPLLRHLEAAGPSELEDPQTELALAPKELESLRSPLERAAAGRREWDDGLVDELVSAGRLVRVDGHEAVG